MIAQHSSCKRIRSVKYVVSQELRSIIQDLIPELVSRKCHIHVGPIHNSSGVTSF